MSNITEPAFAWLNEGDFAVRPLDGSYQMICQNDTLWAQLGIRRLINEDKILPFDFDKVVEEEPTAEELEEQKASEERTWRDAALLLADYAFNMALDKGEDTTTHSEYRELLRGYPQTKDFPFGLRPGETE